MAEMRVGLGYDVHAFADGRRLVLGGIEVPHPRGLAGHSDADVLTHALMDALLGAMRSGDIGLHFPDTDAAYAGVSSLELLAHVAGLMRERGWRLVDADCVVVCELPRITPHRDAMRAALASTLGLEPDRIGVKATTAEGLGAIGRGEGIAAQAVVLLERES